MVLKCRKEIFDTQFVNQATKIWLQTHWAIVNKLGELKIKAIQLIVCYKIEKCK